MSGMDLPPGYYCEIDADSLTVRAPNHKAVSHFVPEAPGEELVAAAREHQDRMNAAIGRLEDLLAERRKGDS